MVGQKEMFPMKRSGDLGELGVTYRRNDLSRGLLMYQLEQPLSMDDNTTYSAVILVYGHA